MRAWLKVKKSREWTPTQKDLNREWTRRNANRGELIQFFLTDGGDYYLGLGTTPQFPGFQHGVGFNLPRLIRHAVAGQAKVRIVAGGFRSPQEPLAATDADGTFHSFQLVEFTSYYSINRFELRNLTREFNFIVRCSEANESLRVDMPDFRAGLRRERYPGRRFCERVGHKPIQTPAKS